MDRTPIGEVTNQVGQTVKVTGWVHTRRDHGKIVFIDLRDRSGILQVVFVPDNPEIYEQAQKLRSEFVVSIVGQINARPQKMVNDKIATGTVELLATGLEILNEAKTPPFEIDSNQESGEEIRMKYRYLDIRRERLKNNLIMRHKIVKLVRDYYDNLGFLEIETPALTKGTPEGAREFIVPARLWPGQFYVLPQSPQQFKQLLMVAGIEKYFQIARCFRDEDTRGDRQAEFTQIDVELSFVSQEEVMRLTEALMLKLIQELYPGKKIAQVPFPRLTYAELMEKYQSDKADLRKNKKDPEELAFHWMIDPPMFKRSEAEKKLVATHHPFTMPNPDDYQQYPDQPEKWRASSYDLILNGTEIWGGSIRIHSQEMQRKVFSVLGLAEAEIQARFGHLLEAFAYGAPPHGGIAAGLDRIVAILQNEESIREVIAFPKTGDSRDLLMGAPSPISRKALQEANIQLAAGVAAVEGFDTALAD
ncbi:MAG TPA: aspartate--tRNA ligase [bacterium]|nr:aspartate--tRNA ligase [bacterium]HNS34271.1 aspartate--tRNA ligase [bacterium]HNZ73063.1 aspartate--tRNA ligase [bacterium]HOH67160.1 aspartate--tRNA ligase [bacterium]